MWFKFFCSVLFIYSISTGEIGEKCNNSDTSKGVCQLVTQCEIALRAIQQQEFHTLQRCGFMNSIEIVCCPIDPYKLTDSAKNKFSVSRTSEIGETVPKKLRVADRECQKIINSSVPPLDLHIIGGTNASLGEFPHMVALGYKRADGYHFSCGGSLLSEWYILTAAHCIKTLDMVAPTIARMGIVEISGKTFNETTDIKIANYTLYPTYTRRTKYNDLALLKLEKPAQLTLFLNPLCLYTSDAIPDIPLTVTGWGKINSRKDLKSDILLKANVTMVDRKICNESYSWHKLPDGIIDSQICAGDPLGRYDACQGDSGGPLQALTSNDGYFRLIGVTSFGRGCGSIVPGVYIRILHYLDWIESVVWPN